MREARLRAPRQDDHRVGTGRTQQFGEGRPGAGAEQVRVVDHDDDRLRARRMPRPSRAVESSFDLAQRRGRIAVGIEEGPDELPLIALRPLLEQRRLAVARGGDHGRDVGTRRPEPVDEPRPPDDALTGRDLVGPACEVECGSIDRASSPLSRYDGEL